MKANLFTYVFFMVLLIGGFYLFEYLKNRKEETSPGTTSIALEPDVHFNSARYYVKEHSIDRSISHLDMAIHSIQLLENVADSGSRAAIDVAIEDLQKVKNEIRGGKVSFEHINHSFIVALNSLAKAQLRLSEKYILDGKTSDAGHALKYASEHIQNAFKYANKSELSAELKVYGKIDSLVNHKIDAQTIPFIETTIQELDETVEP